MMQPRILDICSGAGGAAKGYADAGFDVIGVDIDAHPDFPYAFYIADALDVLSGHELIDDWSFDGLPIDAIHISPPCQRWSTSTADPDRHPDLITPARTLLDRIGLPYIIENVPQAPLRDPIMLCGSSFGLEVRRHRHFETSFPLTRRPNCQHKAQGTPVGVYGQHPDSREFLRPDGTRRGAKATSLAEGQRAMGIDWMQWYDLKEAIPPAYTEHIGSQLISALDVAA